MYSIYLPLPLISVFQKKASSNQIYQPTDPTKLSVFNHYEDLAAENFKCTFEFRYLVYLVVVCVGRDPLKAVLLIAKLSLHSFYTCAHALK